MSEEGFKFLLIALVGFPMFVFAVSLLATFAVGAFNWLADKQEKRLRAKEEHQNKIDEWQKGRIPDWR